MPKNSKKRSFQGQIDMVPVDMDDNDSELSFEDPFEDQLEDSDDEQDMLQTNIRNNADNENSSEPQTELMDTEDGDLDDDEENVKQEVWIPRLHEAKKGEKMEVVSSAYQMIHNMNSEWPCLSFDVVRDPLGDSRTRYPMTAYITAGSQASQTDENCIYLIKVSQMNKTRYDSDSEGEDEDDNTGFDDNPEVDIQKVKQEAPINRIRSMPQHPHVIASWSADSNVYIHQLEHQLKTLDRPQLSSGGKTVEPIFTVSEHTDEGFALAWSPITEGSLISGSCDGTIALIETSQGQMRCINSKSPFRHDASVEDLQWSPSEGNVFASCSVDRSIRIWDTRKTAKPGRRWYAHDADVNVISWNKSVPYLLASGGDDGLIKIWDLRKIKKGNNTQPIGMYDFHQQPITSIEWNPNDPSELVAACEDDTVTVWDMSVERDPEAKGDKYADMTSHLPDQLLFIHQGVENAKEVHYHPQLPGIIISTAESGFSFFKPDIYTTE